MSIDPMKSGSVNPANGPRVDQSGAKQAARQSSQVQRSTAETRESDGVDDRVHLSAEAKAAGGASSTSPSGLSAERLQEILKRVSSGYYDSAPVVNRVAERVKDELSGPGAV